MATHSSVLAWKIPGTGEPDGLLSMGSHRVGHDWIDLAAAAAAALNLKQVCYKQHVVGSCFLSIWPLCLWILRFFSSSCLFVSDVDAIFWIFISCIVFFSSRICLVLFDDFYLYWTSHFVPMLFSWFCWVICQYSNSLIFLKTVVLNSLAGNLYISISLGLITKKALYSFVGVYFPSFLYSLKSCMAMFACEVVFTPSSFY